MNNRPGNAAPEPFSWRREGPTCAGACVLALLARLSWLPHLEAAWDADGAVSCLLALHHAQGYFPLFWYSQGYNGSLEALLAAPWVLALGPRVQAMAASQITLALILIAVMYRTGHALGGRFGAILGCAAYAGGSPPLADNLTGTNHSYTLMVLIGAATLAAGRRALERPTAGTLFGLGVLGGLGLFNNPQGASFLAPVALAFALRGRGWPGLLGREPAPRWIPLARAAIALVFASLAVVALCSAFQWTQLDLGVGTVSIKRPGRTTMLLVMALGALLALCELLLAGPRLIARALPLGLGAALGLSPALAFAARNALAESLGFEPPGIKPVGSPAGLDPARIPAHLSRLFGEQGRELLYNLPPSSAALRATPQFPVELFAWAQAGAVAVLAGCALALFVARRHRAAQLLALRPERPTGVGWLLAVHACTVMAMYAMFPGSLVYPKYLHAIVLAHAALIAWGAGALWRRAPLLGALAAIPLLAAHGLSAVLVEAELRGRRLDPHHESHEVHAILDDLDALRLSEGYANYWHGFRVNYLSGERVVLREWPAVPEQDWAGQRPMLARYHQRVAHALEAGRPIAFVLAPPDSGDTHEEQARRWLATQEARGELRVVQRLLRPTYEIAVAMRR